MVSFRDARVLATDTYNNPENNIQLIEDTPNWAIQKIGYSGEDTQGYTSNHDNGFGASTYYNATTGEIVVAFRGTEGGRITGQIFYWPICKLPLVNCLHKLLQQRHIIRQYLHMPRQIIYQQIKLLLRAIL